MKFILTVFIIIFFGLQSQAQHSFDFSAYAGVGYLIPYRTGFHSDIDRLSSNRVSKFVNFKLELNTKDRNIGSFVIKYYHLPELVATLVQKYPGGLFPDRTSNSMINFSFVSFGLGKRFFIKNKIQPDINILFVRHLSVDYILIAEHENGTFTRNRTYRKTNLAINIGTDIQMYKNLYIHFNGSYFFWPYSLDFSDTKDNIFSVDLSIGVKF